MENKRMCPFVKWTLLIWTALFPIYDTYGVVSHFIIKAHISIFLWLFVHLLRSVFMLSH